MSFFALDRLPAEAVPPKESEILAALYSAKSVWKHDEEITLVVALYFPADKTNTVLRLFDGSIGRGDMILKTGTFVSGGLSFKFPDGTVSRKAAVADLDWKSLRIPADSLSPGVHKISLQGATLRQSFSLAIE